MPNRTDCILLVSVVRVQLSDGSDAPTPGPALPFSALHATDGVRRFAASLGVHVHEAPLAGAAQAACFAQLQVGAEGPCGAASQRVLGEGE
jgi:hypothetical protein